MSRQNTEVTVSHLMLTLLDNPLCDVRVMIQQLDIPFAQVREQFTLSLSRENHYLGTPAFSPLLVELLKDASLLCATSLFSTQTRSGAIFIAILMRPERYLSPNLSTLFQSVNKESLVKEFHIVTKDSAETVGDEQKREDTQEAQPREIMGDTAIARYCHDLTASAKLGEIDPVLCRDDEMDLMIDVLSRRRKNNPF